MKKKQYQKDKDALLSAKAFKLKKNMPLEDEKESVEKGIQEYIFARQQIDIENTRAILEQSEQQLLEQFYKDFEQGLLLNE